jgi:hypothetical protein
MFITSRRRGYDRDGRQVASGLFLMVFSRRANPHELRAAVRRTSMRQCGHWMMGSVRIGPCSLTVSGTYGDDGLPMDGDKLPDAVWDGLVTIPPELTEKFWKGGGWNGAGREAGAMVVWAKAEVAALRRAR